MKEKYLFNFEALLNFTVKANLMFILEAYHQLIFPILSIQFNLQFYHFFFLNIFINYAINLF